jgi:hypothetical protein
VVQHLQGKVLGVGYLEGEQQTLGSGQLRLTCYFCLQDHITLADYEIHDGMGLELYYN